MSRSRFVIRCAALVACCAMAGANLRADILTTGVGGGGGSALTYSGPVDVYGAATAVWLLRAASSADRGNRLINICNAADAACVDWSSSASTGAIVPTSVGGTDCTAITTCTVKTVYDRSGANACTGAIACDVTNATIGNRPTFTWNGGNPFLVFASASSQQLCTTVNLGAAIVQPYTVSSVALRSSGTGFQETLGQNGGTVETGWSNSANTLLIFAGGIQELSGQTDGSFYAVQSVYNSAGGGSMFNVNGSGSLTGTGSSGTNAFSSSLPLCVGSGGGVNFLNGRWREVGVWAGAASIGNQTTLNTQQRTFWSF